MTENVEEQSDQRDELLQLLRWVTDFELSIASADVDCKQLLDIADSIRRLDYPCSDMLRQQWVKMRKHCCGVKDDATRAFFEQEAKATIKSLWAAIEATRLALRSHPELTFAQLPPNVVDELFRLTRFSSASPKSAEEGGLGHDHGEP